MEFSKDFCIYCRRYICPECQKQNKIEQYCTYVDGNNPEIKETLPYVKKMADWTGEEVFMVVQ